MGQVEAQQLTVNFAVLTRLNLGLVEKSEEK